MSSTGMHRRDNRKDCLGNVGSISHVYFCYWL